MNNYINAELIPESYWSSALECSECVHKLSKNTADLNFKKSQALKYLRRQIARTPFRANTYMGYREHDHYIAQLKEDGRFADLSDSFEDIFAAIMRLTAISEAFHWSREKPLNDEHLKCRIFKGITYYCQLEADRTGFFVNGRAAERNERSSG
ncbi:hypothetical protein O9H85_00705 [Paenibacillus filicis]|uniref:HEPN AbiU2-like domain-containing protein n=1 Tax=Paenibacillus gyeongsangnamensis TaxID=3388067 RepID=A0ABT4Q2D5_9BACL|nr:hypothetical protein [Paenibacillus filicis]MCZ8510977.1 hypothetical protein [Paenibacillus filicis]